MMYVSIPFFLLGLTMMIRGTIYIARPDGEMALKRQKRNLKVGFSTDMTVFGQRVRRIGLIMALIGGLILGLSQPQETPAATASSTTPDA